MNPAAEERIGILEAVTKYSVAGIIKMKTGKMGSVKVEGRGLMPSGKYDCMETVEEMFTKISRDRYGKDVRVLKFY